MKRVFQSVVLLCILLATSVVFAQKAKTNNVLNKKAVSLPVPSYSGAARAVGASGAVNVRVTIDETGKVISAEALSGHPLLRKAATDAALEAEFKPFVVGGKAAQVTGTLVYNFTLDGKVSNSTAKDKDSAKETEEESADTEEKEDKAQTDGAANTEASGQLLSGRYVIPDQSIRSFTFSTDGTFVRGGAASGSVRGGTYVSSSENAGTYNLNGDVLTLKYNDGRSEQLKISITVGNEEGDTPQTPYRLVIDGDIYIRRN